MLTMIEAFAPNEDVFPNENILELPLTPDAVHSALIQVRGVTGLGPVNATISSTAIGSSDGEAPTNVRIGKRNIVLTLGLNPDWEDQSVEALREKLYDHFMTKSQVILRFTRDSGRPTVQIQGYVESNEPNIFSKDPEVQISIICLDPDFIATEFTQVSGLVTNINEVGEITYIDYEGTSPTGFMLNVMQGDGAAYNSDLLVLNYAGGVRYRVFVPQAHIEDPLYFFQLLTHKGNKHVYQFDQNADIQFIELLGTTNALLVWPVLERGINEFEVRNEVGGQDWFLYYNARFGGI